ncbi:MAG: hypothetical protein KDI44_17840 [Thiothrix sp.]|nr:hypothetical protein [Thiothrix sp.]HPQ94599.1 hypothetical protein [Thiolinea sp.]
MGKPKVPEQQPTAVEQQLFRINQDRLQNYQQGQGLQNALIRQMTGRRWDGSQWGVDPSAGVVGANGQVPVDNGRALAAADQQWAPLLQQYDPNAGQSRTGRVGLLQNYMGSRANVAAQVPLQAQTGYLQALANVAGMGQGQLADTSTMMTHQAQQAAAQAAQDAQQGFRQNVADQQAAQGLLGLGATSLLQQVPTYDAQGNYIPGAYDARLRGFFQ